MEDNRTSLRTAIIKILSIQYLREKKINFILSKNEKRFFVDEDLYNDFSIDFLEYLLNISLSAENELEMIKDKCELLEFHQKYYIYNKEKQDYILLSDKNSIEFFENENMELIPVYDFHPEIYQRLDKFDQMIKDEQLTEFVQFYHNDIEYQIPLYVGILFKAMHDLIEGINIDYMQKNIYNRQTILGFISKYGEIQSLLNLSVEQGKKKDHWCKTVSFLK